MKYLVGAKITSIEYINNPLEIEADSIAEAIEKAEKINCTDSDQIHHQKLLLEDCETEFFITEPAQPKSATLEQCPYCLSDDIGMITKTVKIENRVLETAKCYACEKKWVEIYTLSRRENGNAEIIQEF